MQVSNTKNNAKSTESNNVDVDKDGILKFNKLMFNGSIFVLNTIIVFSF